MKALRYYGPGDIRIEETPMPVIGKGEVLVRVHAAGVCATDVKTFQRGHPKIQPGSVIGHEISGVITQVLDAPGWIVGDRVTVAPYAPCLECDQCKRKQYSTCDHLMDQGIDPGGFAEYVRVPSRIVSQCLIRISDEVPLRLAAITEPLACCIHGLEVLALKPDDTLLIIGDGAMGLIQALLAKKKGIGKIILAGMIPKRLVIAREFADIVIDANSQDTAVELFKAAPGGANKVIVSVGNIQVAENAINYVSKGGTINIYAGMPKDQMMSVNPYRIHYDEVQLLGTFGFSPDHFRQAAENLLPLKNDIEKVLSGSVALEDIKTALTNTAEFRGIKYLVEFP
ncbi:MAG: alcohol dehydrogenase catalytic domain-containing protein [Chloroflexota bacterium]